MNTFPALVGMGLLVGTTMILALVFIPRVSTFHSHLLKHSSMYINVSGIFCTIGANVGPKHTNEFKLRIVTHCTQCLGYYNALLDM